MPIINNIGSLTVKYHKWKISIIGNQNSTIVLRCICNNYEELNKFQTVSADLTTYKKSILADNI